MSLWVDGRSFTGAPEIFVPFSSNPGLKTGVLTLRSQHGDWGFSSLFKFHHLSETFDLATGEFVFALFVSSPSCELQTPPLEQS